MSEKLQSTQEVKLSEAVREATPFYRSIGMPEPVEKLHEVDCGSKIVKHMTHSFDEHGNVIVIEGESEDLEKSIGQYQNEVGPKNVIRMIEAGADPMNLINANRDNAMYGSFTDLDVKSVNELKDVASVADAGAQKALADFNAKFGTSLDMKSFLDLYDKGLLSAHVEGVNKVKEESTDGEK